MKFLWNLVGQELLTENDGLRCLVDLKAENNCSTLRLVIVKVCSQNHMMYLNLFSSSLKRLEFLTYGAMKSQTCFRMLKSGIFIEPYESIELLISVSFMNLLNSIDQIGFLFFFWSRFHIAFSVPKLVLAFFFLLYFTILHLF